MTVTDAGITWDTFFYGFRVRQTFARAEKRSVGRAERLLGRFR
jgi:hypothetical protein